MLQGEAVIYGQPHPTIAMMIRERGYNTACIWVCDHLRNMFALSSFPIDDKMISGLARTITVRYKHLMLPEFIHFCFLYRTGEFSQATLKPNGDCVLRALREYSKLRDGIIGNLREKTVEPQTTDRHPMTPEIKEMIAQFLLQEKLRQGNWRQEPWGTPICRAYFVDKTLPTFPGDMTQAQRVQWALAHGCHPSQLPPKEEDD